MFENNSRIEYTENGIRFYEQDIAFCTYIFTGVDLYIDMNIDYVMPGIGIVLSMDSINENVDTSKAYLFKLGINSFTVYKKENGEVTEVHSESCIFSPSRNPYNQLLRITLQGQKMTIVLVNGLTSLGEDLALGSYTMDTAPTNYKIGIYSSRDNIVHSISFLEGIPAFWHKSIANVNGGRMSFFQDGFLFEECEKDAELEEVKIPLPAGKYYLDYQTEAVNDVFDIESYVFDSELDKNNVTDIDLEDIPREGNIGDWEEMQGTHFLRQLYAQLFNGLSTVLALEEMARLETDERYLTMVQDFLYHIVTLKHSLSKTMAYYNKEFPTMVRSYIEQGESTDKLLSFIEKSIEYLEDQYKQLLDGDGSFVLEEDGYVNLKFKGHSGKITKVSIRKRLDGEYIRTHDSQIINDGSWVAIPLKTVKKVRWYGVIDKVPDWDNLFEACPYSVVGIANSEDVHNNNFTEDPAYNMRELNLKIGTTYFYTYDVETGTLRISLDENSTDSEAYTLHASKTDSLVIFHTLDGMLSEIVITNENGQEINVMTMKGSLTYVPGSITGPIIAVANGEPLDISACYREVVIPTQKIVSFSQAFPIQLPENIIEAIHQPEVYGVYTGDKIYPGKTTIEEYAPARTKIARSSYSIEDSSIVLPDKIRDKYSRIVVVYNSIDEYSYYFTTSAREYFEADANSFALAYTCRETDSAITLYGIKKDATINDDKFFRVMNSSQINSIDLYTVDYEVISHRQYQLEDNALVLDDSLKEEYQSFVVDYDRKDSYSINYNSELGQYEVIALFDGESAVVIYDMQNGSVVNEYYRTTIMPDKNKYISLRRKEGAFD